MIAQVISMKERGQKRIRTAVQGFADLCLATRPSDPMFGTAKVRFFI